MSFITSRFNSSTQPGKLAFAAIISLAFLLSNTATAQEAERNAQSTVYITVTQIDTATAAEMPSAFASAGELRQRIAQLGNQGVLRRSSSFRSRTLTGLPSEVQFGKSVAQAVATMTSRSGGISRQMNMVDIGTAMQSITSVIGQEAIGEVSYSCSYLLKPAKEDDPPSIANVESETTFRAKLGSVVLLYSYTRDDNSVYLYGEFSLERGQRRSTGAGATSTSRSSGGGATLRANQGGSFGAARSSAARSSAARSSAARSSAARSNAGGASRSQTEGYERYLKYAASQVKRYDSDTDGMLNEKELAQVSILKRYKGMDRNGDGKVSAEELALTMQKR